MGPGLMAVLLAASAASAAIWYDETNRCLRVVDFPESRPCTLARLLAVDRLYGWEKVAYDPAQDTYTITGDLWIGSNNGTDTVLQIGSPQHPRETLVMAGSLVVHPYWIAGDNREADYWKGEKGLNRLALGLPGNEAIQASLRFRDEAQAGHTLILGRIPWPDGTPPAMWGGQLWVHGGTITSALADKTFGLKVEHFGMNLTGESVVLERATLSRVTGAATYGLGAPRARVTGTVFDQVGVAIMNDRHDLADCVFSRCGIALRDYGALDAVLTECVFRDNDRNWTLSYSDKGLVCIDCTIGAPRLGDIYQCWKNPQTGQTQYPSFTAMRHVVVEVVDETGRPVAGAQVKLRSDQPGAELSRHTTLTTDAAGRTPGRSQEGAALLVEAVKQATAQPNQPRVTEPAYVVTASAAGFVAGRVEGFRPTESWGVLRITLRRG